MNILAEKREKIKNLIQKYWDIEYDISGSQTTYDCIDFVTSGGKEKQFDSPDGGSKIDLKELIDAAVTAITFITFALEIYDRMSETSTTKVQVIIIKEKPECLEIEESKRVSILTELGYPDVDKNH
jgi:ssDNA-binding replication factor A large subunit